MNEVGAITLELLVEPDATICPLAALHLSSETLDPRHVAPEYEAYARITHERGSR